MRTEIHCVFSDKEKGRAGMTLVETVTAFLLFAVLAALILLILQPSLRIVSRNRSANESMIVGDILLEELEGRLSGVRSVDLESDAQGTVLTYTAYDGQEYPVRVEDGRLHIGAFVFGEGAYAGFSVTRLTAEWEKEEEGILRLDLTLKNEYDVTYSRTRLIRIYGEKKEIPVVGGAMI